MDITINTPALLFPAISLIMLAYTNRFLALASLIRTLHSEYVKGGKQQLIQGQIKNLRYRIRLVKNMQALGVVSFICCIGSMYFIYINNARYANILFAMSLLCFTASLLLSLLEIQRSTKALEIQLGNMEELKDPSLVSFIKSKFEKE